MIRQLLLSFLFLAFASNGVVAQNYDTYWNYDISDGLPTNSIYHLFIDSKGKIWFGSDLGVTCYDGQYFKTYTTDDGLEDNTVLRCFEDRSGRIWFHHNNRLPSYYINGEINTVKNPDKDIVISSGSQFVQKKNGNIYLSATNGLLIIHEDLTTSIIYDKSQDPASIVGLINDTLFLSTTEFGPKNLNSINYCIGCMENFLSYRDLSHTMLRSPEYFIENFLKHNRKLKLDPLISKVTNGQTYFIRKYKNKTYLTTINGIYIFSEKNDKLFLEKNILTNLKIVSIDFDQAGNMWASSLGNGLYFFPNNGIEQLKITGDAKILTQSLYKNLLLLGMNSGEVLQVDGKTIKIFSPLEKETNSTNNTCNLKYFNDSTWLMCNRITIKYKEKSNKVHVCENFNGNSYKTIKSTFDNRYYLTSYLGIVVVDPKSGEFYRDAKQIAGKIRKVADFQNNIYLATQTGVFKYSRDKIERIFERQIGNSRVNDIEVYNGKLVISSSNIGIWVYDGKTITNLTAKDKLLSNQVNFLRRTVRNTLWISTNLGLQEIQISQKNKISEVKRYDLKTNILNSEIVDIDDIGDYLILTTENGILSLNNSYKNNLKKLQINIEEIVVNNTRVNSQISNLIYGDNLEIITSAPNFTKHATEYFFRINNGKWIKNNSETFSFLQLGAGNYNLEFFARSPFFLDSDIVKFNFIIKEKWYQSMLFTLFVLIIISTGSILIARHRIILKSERKKNELKTELLSLQSQMNPHFTFNSLNSIQGYMGSHNLREAQIYLADFAGLMRSILDQAKLHLISIEEEVNFIKSYLNLEKRRLDNQFEYYINVDPEINSTQFGVPTLLIQPFVENAIWHGVAGLEKNGEIFVNFKIEGSQILCEIQDNGVGIKESETKKKFRPYHKSKGIENCKARISLFEEIYHKKIDLNIESDTQANFGTKVILTFPIMNLNQVKI